jgi:hypothetical protein
MVTKETEAEIYSISGIHRSTNENNLEYKLLSKRSRIVNNVAVEVVPVDSSNNVDSNKLGGDITVIPNIRILKRADSVTGIEYDTAQQQFDSSTNSNVSNTQFEKSNGITSLDNTDNSTSADDSKEYATSESSQGTTTKDNGKSLTTDDQVIAPVFFLKKQISVTDWELSLYFYP